MSINTRDFADRSGAVFGTATGVALASYLFAAGAVSNLVINGQQCNVNPIVGAPLLYGLTVGVCANLCRNAAVGIHDTVKFTAQAAKGACAAMTQLFNRCRRHQQAPNRDIV